MAKLGRPRGLIDFESWNNIERGRRAEPAVNRLVRPKTIGLTAACVALAGVISVAFAARTTAALSVQHDRDPVAVRLSDGSVRNAYTVKLLNKSGRAQRYRLSVEGLAAKLAIVGNEGLLPIEVAPDSSEQLRVTLTASPDAAGDVVFTAREETGSDVLTARDKFVER
jgi:polyferredoxin